MTSYLPESALQSGRNAIFFGTIRTKHEPFLIPKQIKLYRRVFGAERSTSARMERFGIKSAILEAGITRNLNKVMRKKAHHLSTRVIHW